MTDNHTPEPWEAEDCTDGGKHIFGGPGLTTLVACASDMIGPDQLVGIDPDDARRIVACVNACKDFSTEMLEQAASEDANRIRYRLAYVQVSER